MMSMVLLALCAVVIWNVADAANDAPVIDFVAAVNSASDRLALASEQGASGILRIKYADRVPIESGFSSASCTIKEDVTPEHIFMIGSITFEGIGAGMYFDDPAQLEKYKSSRMVYSKFRQLRVMGPGG